MTMNPKQTNPKTADPKPTGSKTNAMVPPTRSAKKQPVAPVTKPYLTGNPTDENTLKYSLIFLGVLLLTVFMCFIVCSATASAGLALRLPLNLVIVLMVLVLFYNNGTSKGADAVTRGEILYQKQEKGQEVRPSEKAVCFHKAKGFLIGLLGTLPLLIFAVIFACSAKLQLTEAGALPSWMQAYMHRSEIGDPLVQYTVADPMGFVDILRVVIRICVLPFINIVGSADKAGTLLIERLSPVILLLPGLAYGFGYLSGRSIRIRVHTAISEDKRRRIRREKKARKARLGFTAREKGPRQLN